MNDTKTKRQCKIKQKWADEDYYDMMCDIASEVQNREDQKLLRRNMMLGNWSNMEWADERLKKCFKYKDYEMPSGRIVKLQGYEPQILDELLTEYDESDIFCEVKDINKEIGKIKYMYEDNEHVYYPDFYIKSTNTIIEVKSEWTYNKWQEKNIAKKQSCQEQGFNFKFIIL